MIALAFTFFFLGAALSVVAFAFTSTGQYRTAYHVGTISTLFITVAFLIAAVHMRKAG